MRIFATDQPLNAVETDALIIPVFQKEKELWPPARDVDTALKGAVSTLFELRDLRGRRNETAVLYPAGAIPARRVVVVGLGKEGEITPDHCRQAAGTAARRAYSQGARTLAVAPPSPEALGLTLEAVTRATVEGMLMGLYKAKNHKTSSLDEVAVSEASILIPEGENHEVVERGLQTGQIFADAACTARDLVNQPGNHMTPALLADVARAISVSEKLSCEVLEAQALEQLNMGALLGVAKGSTEPPKFIILQYNADHSEEEKKKPCFVLVGKGVTFDSGGISLKSKENMDKMKTDMAGAAAVIAVLQGVARLGLPFHVVALAPACENLPSGAACKPGDVLEAMNGKTIEVVNTDAEGRLILADALCYAERFKPEVVIDVATLTGACVMALGEEVAAGLFATDEELSGSLVAAGGFNGEKLWPMPLFDEYRDKIRSEIADMKNTGGRYGGVGSAAVFLKEFVSYPWAHIDIAGMATVKKDTPYIPRGGTGFAVRTILSFLMDRVEKVQGAQSTVSEPPT